jgi:hypothetical protein
MVRFVSICRSSLFSNGRFLTVFKLGFDGLLLFSSFPPSVVLCFFACFVLVFLSVLPFTLVLLLVLNQSALCQFATVFACQFATMFAHFVTVHKLCLYSFAGFFFLSFVCLVFVLFSLLFVCFLAFALMFLFVLN